MIKKWILLFLFIVSFIGYCFLDYLNIPSSLGINFKNLNSDLFGIIVNSLVVIVLYIITYFEIDKRQLNKDENAQKVGYSLLLRSYKSCLAMLDKLINKPLYKKYFISKKEFEKLENPVYSKLKNNPFDSYEDILTLAREGNIEEVFFNKFLKIRDDYRNYITFCITFFDLDSIELNDELKELNKYISNMKNDLISELQQEIAFIEKMIKVME